MRYSIRLRHGWARGSFLLLLNISEAQFLRYWDSDEDVKALQGWDAVIYG